MTTSEERAAPTAQPEGMVAGDWVLVPREPTEAMVDNAFDLETTEERRRGIWKCMVAAAPAPLRADAPTNWFDGTEDADGNPLRADAGEERRDPLIHAVASLRAAISLLERGGKKAAPSDKMFEQMLADYRRAADNASAALSPASSAPEGEYEPIGDCAHGVSLMMLCPLCPTGARASRAVLQGDADHG